VSDYDLVCIGSGPAGQRAAIQAAKLGKRAAVIEKRHYVGGCSIGTGTIPSKTLREAVITFTGSGGFVGRPELKAAGRRPTMEQLLARVEQVMQREMDVVADQLERNRVELVHGAASFLDAKTLSIRADNGAATKITAENILVAVGTEPGRPPSTSSDADIVITSDGILQLKQLPHTMAVVGGGVIGIEYASMFAALGVEVILIEKRERPLEFLDVEIVDELIHQMRKRNVTFRLGESVAHLEIAPGPPRGVIILLESGKRIFADIALFSIGRIGATEGLNLEAAGISPDERGRIKVDSHFRTSTPNVLAAGDVIGFPSLAATSAEQGRLAACEAFGVPASSMPDNFPIGIYSIPEISMVGSPEHDLTTKKIPYETGVARYREIARGQILGDDSGMFKMLFHRETKALLGVHVIGTGATELIHIGQAVMGLNGGLDYFLKTVFNYPTLAECYKVAALDAFNKLSH
jgi:NAD(P) transhydrogenase